MSEISRLALGISNLTMLGARWAGRRSAGASQISELSQWEPRVTWESATQSASFVDMAVYPRS